MTRMAGQKQSIRLKPARQGAAVIVAIVCLAVAAMVFLGLLRTIIAQRETVQTEAWRVQAAWLAESGLERAMARLAKDRQYSGETWTIPADLLDARNGAVVTIKIEPAPEEPNGRLVRVQADFPDHPEHRARQTKEVTVPLRPAS